MTYNAPEQTDPSSESAMRLARDAAMSEAHNAAMPTPTTTWEKIVAPTRAQDSSVGTARSILEEACRCLRARGVEYDTPQGERSMSKTVALFNLLHGTSLTEVQGWQFMEILKMVRSTQGAPKADTFIDGAAYAALAGEAALCGATNG